MATTYTDSSGRVYDPKGYFTGPGGWLYYIAGGGVLVVWSPTTRREVNQGLDAAASQRVILQIAVSGRYLGTNKAAALLAVQGGTSTPTAPAATGLTSYLPTMPGFTSSTPTTTTTPAPGADTGTKITDQPWFVPAVIGGLGLLAVLAFSKPSKAKAAPPSSRYAGLF